MAYDKFDENLLFEFNSAFWLQGWLSQEEKKLQQALKLSQPTARSPLFLNQVTSPLLIINLLSIPLPREIPPLPLCHQPRKTTCSLWRLGHREVLHLLAARPRGLERLPHTEVRFPFIFNLSYHSHVSNQERSYPEVKHSCLTIPTILSLISIPFSAKRGATMQLSWWKMRA